MSALPPPTEQTAEQHPAAESVPAPRKRGPWRSRLVRGALVLALMSVSTGVGVVLAFAVGGNPGNPEHRPAPARRPASAEEIEPPDQLHTIDEWIRAGSYDLAARQCVSAARSDDISKRNQALYRLGLCQEGTGKFDEAIRTFDGLASAEGIGPWARLGKARCRLRAGKTGEAAALFKQSEPVTSSTSQTGAIPAGELAYLQAALEKSEKIAGRTPTPLAASPASAELIAPVAQYLPAVASTPEASPDHAEIPDPSAALPDAPAGAEPLAEPPDRQLRDACNRAVGLAPHHPLAGAALLEIANADAEDGHWVSAAGRYREILTTAPEGPVARLAQYNLGLAYLQLWDLGRAREQFLLVIDTNPTDELAGLARWWVARTYLDSADGARAVRPLTEAARSKSATVRTAAALGLCAVRLLAQDDAAAHAALRAGPRPMLRSPRFRDDAAFLDALCRSRLSRAKGGSQAADSAEELAWSLEGWPEDSPLGPIGLLLRARALQEMGLESQAAQLCDRALPICRGPLAAQLAHLAAEVFFRRGDFAAARQRLVPLCSANDPAVRSRAQLRLAEIALRSGAAAECVSLCRSVAAAPGPDQQPSFQIMGRAYEALGDHRRAADCFGGRLPAN